MTKTLHLVCLNSLLGVLALFSACKKCDNSFASNFEERGTCEFLSAASSDMGFSLEDKNYTLIDPENGGVWNGICSNWNTQDQTTLLSWMNFSWNGEVWTLNLEVPIQKNTALASGMEFTFKHHTPCPSETLEASAIVYLWNEPSATFSEYVTTDSSFSGYVTFSNVVDGNVFNNPEYWYVDGSFRFNILINGQVHLFENGFFSNALIRKEYI